MTSSNDRPRCLENSRREAAELCSYEKSASLHFRLNQDSSFAEHRFQDLMRQHPYLGALPKIGETLWYVATWREEWAALLSFSASALKCAARDRWIGWDFRHQ
jgi:hypothetical protein